MAHLENKIEYFNNQLELDVKLQRYFSFDPNDLNSTYQLWYKNQVVFVAGTENEINKFLNGMLKIVQLANL